MLHLIIMLNHRQTFPVGKGSRIMAAHRIPLQDFRSNFVDRKILKVDKTRKIKAALIKGYSVINFPEGTTHQPQSSLISARLQWPD
jgi:hypothetical protein